MWLFINRIGKLSQQFHALSGSMERSVFAMENFGKEWCGAIGRHDAKLRIDIEKAFSKNE